MSTIRKNAVAEREVTHFVLASLSNYDRFPYSFLALVTIFFLRPCFYFILILALILVFILFCTYFVCVGLDMDENQL